MFVREKYYSKKNLISSCRDDKAQCETERTLK